MNEAIKQTPKLDTLKLPLKPGTNRIISSVIFLVKNLTHNNKNAPKLPTYSKLILDTNKNNELSIINYKEKRLIALNEYNRIKEKFENSEKIDYSYLNDIERIFLAQNDKYLQKLIHLNKNEQIRLKRRYSNACIITDLYKHLTWEKKSTYITESYKKYEMKFKHITIPN